MTDLATLSDSEINAIAFRGDNPAEWSGVELAYEISLRICKKLGLTHETPAIRDIAILEEQRQRALWDEYEKLQAARAREAAYRERMTPWVRRVAHAIDANNHTRRVGDLERSLLDALRPLDARLQELEQKLAAHGIL